MSAHVQTVKQEPVKRRKFLAIAWAGALFAFGVGTVAAFARFIQPVSAGGFGGLVRAGKVQEFAPGSMSHIQTGRFYLYRLEDGSFLAMWQRCTHLGCSVPWVAAEDQFHCPCHGSLFDKLGLVTGGPAPRPLDYFKVEIRGDEVFVDTSNPIQRAGFNPDQTTKA